MLTWAKKSFTLIELLLVIAIFTVISSVSVPVYHYFFTVNDLDMTTSTLNESLRRAQTLSRAVYDDSDFGLKLVSGQIIIFKGSSYASRDSSFDEVYYIANTIGVSGADEIVFNKFSGDLDAALTIGLQSINGKTQNISINQKGYVE